MTREQARAIAHEYFARVRAHKREQEDAARREDQRQTWCVALVVAALAVGACERAPKPGEPVCTMTTRGAPVYCEDKDERVVPCPADTSKLKPCAGQGAR